MNFPRSLLLVPTLLIAGLVVYFVRPGPSPRPGEGEGDPVEAPVVRPEIAAPGLPAPLPAAVAPDVAPRDVPAASPPAPLPPPAPRGPRPVRVVDLAGEPIVGAEVAVLDDLPDVRAGVWRGVARTARTRGTTDAAGAYVVAADAPRAGALRVRASGFAEKTVGLEPFPTDIRLAPARNLRVRVLDDHGRPIGNATVRAVGPVQDAEARTDADGRADLVADGSEWRRLEVFADGFTVELRDATLTGLPREDPLTVVLRAARPLSGRVVADEDGRPLEGATVTLVTGAVERGIFATATTGADGGFTLRIEVPRLRVFTLEATAPERLLGIVSFATSDAAGERPIEIRLDRGRPLDGRVTDGAGAPVAGARVHAVPVYVRATSAPEREAATVSTTDAQGRFQVRAPKAGADARWHVVARGPNGEWGSLPVPRGDLPEAPLVIVLEGAGFLEGRVVSSAGVGVGGVRVRPTATAALSWLVGAQPAPEGASVGPTAAVSTDSTVTAPDGTFRLGPLPAGDAELSVEQDGQRLGRPLSARVIGGKTVALDPLVLDVGEITGVVLDNASLGVPGAFVRLTRTGTSAADTPVRDARTDDLGRFRFTALDVAEALSIHVVGQALTAARLERAFPRAEPYELRLTRLPQITLTVTRGERLYDGPLLVSVASRPVGTDHTLTSMSPAWMTCVSGLLSFSMPSAGTYAVQVRTAEEEPAEASGVTTTDAADPTVMRVTLDLRVPDPAAPDGGMSPGK